MKRKVLNKELEGIYVAIQNCGELTEQPIRTKLFKNALLIKNELEVLYSGLSKPEKWNEYLKKERQIVEKFVVEKDEKGVPYFGSNQNEFEKEILSLKEEYSDTINEEAEMRKEFFDKVLDVECELEFTLIKEDEIPKRMTLAQLMGVSVLIK